MDEILSIFDFDIFFFFIPLTLLEFINIFIIYRKVRKHLGFPLTTLPFINRTNIIFRNILGILVLIIMIPLIMNVINGQNPLMLIIPIFFYITYLFQYSKMNNFNYNDKGVILFNPNSRKMLGIEYYNWESLIKLAIDKDINQKNYGLMVYTPSSRTPIRFWVDRKYMIQVIDLFKKYNVTIEERI